MRKHGFWRVLAIALGCLLAGLALARDPSEPEAVARVRKPLPDERDRSSSPLPLIDAAADSNHLASLRRSSADNRASECVTR